MGLRTTDNRSKRRHPQPLVSVFSEPNSLKRSKFGPTQGADGKPKSPRSPSQSICYAENPPKLADKRQVT
jgi:hypothetical protein